MPREKRPDDIARENAPEPAEPLGTEHTTLGTVKYWRDDKGHGVISSDATAPWDIWCHFTAVALSGYVAQLFSGERVEVTFDKTGRPYLLNGEPFVGMIQGNATRSLKAGDRVEVLYQRANQESFKYVARHVRRVDPAAGGA